MRNRSPAVLVKALSIGLVAGLSIALVASAQNQTSDTLQSLKNSLSPDQQGSILQEVLGKGGINGEKTDSKLDSPETVRRKNGEQGDLFDKDKLQKTLDGRTLRQSDEDPELRANDVVLMELVDLDELCDNTYGQNGDQNNRQQQQRQEQSKSHQRDSRT